MDEQQTGRGERKVQFSIQLPPTLLAWLDSQPGSRAEVVEGALARARGAMNAVAAPDSMAARMVAFLGALAGMDFVEGSDGVEVVDLCTGRRVRADPDFPDGEYLQVSHDGRGWVSALGYRVADVALVRHAEMRAVIDGTKVAREYERISAHFVSKVGLDG